MRQHLRGPSFDSLRRAFKIWIESTLIKRVAKDEKTVEYRNLDEIQSMLAERVERWTQEWERKGIEKGREEGIEKGIDMGIVKGRQEGREEGIDMGRLDERKKLLSKILTSRYGNIEAYLERIQNADLDQLEIWLDQSLGSCSLQEIFT